MDQQHDNTVLEIKAIKRKIDIVLERRLKTGLSCEKEVERLNKRIRCISYYLSSPKPLT